MMNNLELLNTERRKEVNKRLIQLSLIMILIFLIIPSIKATGCCFNPDNGFCSANVEQSSCASPGEFYSNSDCSGIDKCSKGCCLLGSNALYRTSRTCELESRQGFDYPNNFQYTDEESCYNLGASQVMGACLLGGEYEQACKFTSYDQCPTGDFKEGILCSDESLNTICEKTKNTMCYGENVHYIDTCGNPDALVETCDYASGSICKKKNSKEAYCLDLNCDVNKLPTMTMSKFLWKPESESDGNLVILYSGTSGDTSIYDNSGTLIETGRAGGPSNGYGASARFSKPGAQYNNAAYVQVGVVRCAINNPGSRITSCSKFISPINEKIVNGDQWCVSDDPNSVGSRYFSQYCLNGEIYTEPCADFRMETCIAGTCVINPASQCLAANPTDAQRETSDTWKEDCASGCLLIGEFEERKTYSGTFRYYNPYFHNWIAKSYTGETKESMETLIKSVGGVDNTITKEEDDPMMEDLEEILKAPTCVPVIPPGLAFYPKNGQIGTQTTAKGTCAQGSAEVIIEFVRAWFLVDHKASESDYYDAAGMLYNVTASDFWGLDGDKNIGLPSNHDYFDGGDIWDLWTDNGYRKIPINTEVVAMLNERCRALGDCGGKSNWVGEEGGISGIECPEEGLCFIEGSRSLSTNTLTFKFVFECLPFKAPLGNADCSKCGADGLPCSEYRCMALGKACEYTEPDGADKGFCVSSSDHIPASISHSLNPQSPIPPFTPVEISVTTNEVASCKFDLGDSGNTYEEMEYNLGEEWGTEHKVRLNLPGQTKSDEEFPEYDLIKEDGKYEMFVRCEDTAGNPNIAAHLISFEVMQTPDTIPPIIYMDSFEPGSGSAIKYNTTNKQIKFEIDWPAECKWDSQDKGYNLMGHEFECDSIITDKGIIDGYFCNGVLTGVTNDTKEETKYYIRCKDQPWLEGNEDDLYKRNTNEISKEYVLKASEELKIIELAPSGNIIKNSLDTSLQISVITAGGGNLGRTECRWNIVGECLQGQSSAYKLFPETNSKNHKDTTTNLSGGRCYINTKCEDSSGNKVNMSSSFDLLIDNNSPRITRVYHFAGDLVIITDEESQCKFTTDDNVNCDFEWDDVNTTLMTGSALEHQTSWKNNEKYYIKCKDYRENINPGCGIIARTY